MSHIHFFKCPVCKRLHPINERAEDYDELSCTDNVTSRIKEFRGVENPSALTNSAWNFNKASTRRKVFSNDAPLINVTRNNPHPRRVVNW